MVEDIEEAVMERQSGTENCSHHHIVCRHTYLRIGKRSMHRLHLIVEGLAHLIRHHLADTADIVAEHETVLLVVLVAYLCKILVHH